MTAGEIMSMMTILTIGTIFVIIDIIDKRGISDDYLWAESE